VGAFIIPAVFIVGLYRHFRGKARLSSQHPAEKASYRKGNEAPFSTACQEVASRIAAAIGITPDYPQPA
jgi:hypothetical protein